MTTPIATSLARVEKLLKAGKKPVSAPVKAATKPAPVKAAAKKDPVKAAAKLTATPEVWEQAHAIVASFPNLRKIQRQVDRGVLSIEEVVGAVSEALRKKRVSQHLVDAVSEVLRNAFAVDMVDEEVDVIDVGADPEMA